MAEHQTITGFVVSLCCAVAATAAAMRSYSPSTERCLVAAGGNLAVDVNEFPTEDFDDHRWLVSRSAELSKRESFTKRFVGLMRLCSITAP